LFELIFQIFLIIYLVSIISMIVVGIYDGWSLYEVLLSSFLSPMIWMMILSIGTYFSLRYLFRNWM